MNEIAPNSFKNSREWIQWQFNAARHENQDLSLRKFADRLDISPGRLSQLLSGKKLLTEKAVRKICKQLGLEYDDEKVILSLVQVERKHEKTSRKLLNSESDQDYQRLNQDHFESIHDWYYFALLNLIKLKDFKNETSWIADRLGLDEVIVSKAMEKLFSLGLLSEESGKVVRTHKSIQTSDGIPSSFLRESHKQSLLKVLESLESDDLERRDITSMTMAIERSKLPEAKIAIKNFRREITNLLETRQADDVYELNIQLVPVTKK